jgi:hypothetical protein
MKAKFDIGAELNFITKEEMDQALRGWMAESVRGIRFVPFYGQFAKTGATFTISPNTVGIGSQGSLGPAAGFLWSVMQVAVFGPGVAAGDLFQVFDNDTSASRVRVPNLTNAGKSFNKGEFVLRGPNKIMVTGASTGTGTEIFVSGTAIEVPDTLAWQLC